MPPDLPNFAACNSPKLKKKLPPPHPHNTTHKNIRHIGQHHNTPYHNTTTSLTQLQWWQKESGPLY